MSETKTKSVKSVKSKSSKISRGRGRPEKPMILPKSQKFTVNDVVTLNPLIECRLTVYNHIKRLIKARQIRKTNEKKPTGGVGKPMAIFQRVPQPASRKPARKPVTVNTPAVDLTPATVPAEPVIA